MTKFRILALLLFLPAALFVWQHSAAKVYAIGERGPAGGWVFYDKGSYSGGWRYLEAAPREAGEAEWGAKGNMAGTETRIGSGKRNTELIVATLKDLGESGKAAQLCAGYELSGYRDWFLPGRNELNLMYKNLKQKGRGNFKDGWYWSSSEYAADSAWLQDFSVGSRYGLGRNNSFCVRAARAF
jgi:hypothetical protein